MSYLKEQNKSKFKSRHTLNILRYINSTEVIKDKLLNKKITHNSFDEKEKTYKMNSSKNIKSEINLVSDIKIKKNIKNKNKIDSKLFKDLKKDQKNSTNLLLNSNTTKIRTMKRPLSSNYFPCKAITLNKRNGFYNNIIIKDINNNNVFYLKEKKFRNCLSAGNDVKKKKVKLKQKEEFKNNFMDKSPIDLLVERKERLYNIKLNRKKFSDQKTMGKFMKKNFKNARNNFFMNKYFYIKSKLNTNTKSSENKLKNEEKALNFDNKKFILFKNISKKLKKRIKYSSKILDAKKILEKITKEKKLENLARISELKSVVEDERILLTPRNFMKTKKDPFECYKINELVQQLNSDFTYKYRFIIAKNFGIKLEKYLLGSDKEEKIKNITKDII